MKKIHLIMIVVIALSISTYAQIKDKYEDRAGESNLVKTMGIGDRAAGIHNASNIGLFFENRGKLYPRRISQGPSGEFPINSGMNYIYRINQMIGVPGNVVQGRFTTDEEWEAVGGYHNPDLSLIAFSDNPSTWPETGWPVKDENGNPIIKSDQDSYCVFDDANNTKRVLGIEVHQTGYTYGVKFAQNIIFFKYDIINKSANRIDGLYFDLYTDIDVGDIEGGEAEWADDFLDYDRSRNFLYFYDDGLSNEWPGGKTGYFGVALLKTPSVNGVELGLTDLHYNEYYDDQDIDSVQYGIMSSQAYLFNSVYGDRYFHLGDNQGLHFDDPNTIPAGGADLVANASSGPYSFEPGDTLTFYTAILAGSDYEDISNTLDVAFMILDYNFEISKPPTTPTLTGVSGDSKVTLFWNDLAETSVDNFSGEYDFEGYRLYRSQDKGINWTKLAEYDLVDGIGNDVGIEYSYLDQTVTNGFEYWYSLTSYDRGDSSVVSLESPKGNTVGAINLISVIPYSNAIGRVPVSTDNVVYSGTGLSNYNLEPMPVDNDVIGGNHYDIGFYYTSRTTMGKLKTESQVVIRDSSRTGMNNYRIEFVAPDKLNVVDLATGDFVGQSPKIYRSGATYTLNPGLAVMLTDPDPNVESQFLPKAGDKITVNFATYAIRNSVDTVIYPRPFELDQLQATSDGVIFKINPPEIIQNVSRIGGTESVEITFTVDDETIVKENLYLVSTEGNGVDASGIPFVSIIVRDQNQNIVAQADTLYDLDFFYFDGLRGKVNFNSVNAPSPGNVWSVTTIIPIPLDVRDKYSFDLVGSSINRQVITDNIKNIKVVPNPYKVGSLYEPEFGELRMEPLRQIQFVNLPNECTIYIFTIDADLVKTLYHNSVNGTEIWDLRAEGGREIAPGIYIYVVKAEGVEHLSRFAIIK